MLPRAQQVVVHNGVDPAAAGVRDGSTALIAGAFLAALAYATFRYNVFKGVPWTDWPAYTLNKALAFASLILIALTVIRISRGLRTSKIMLAAGALALCHSLLSFALLNPLYYPKLYEAGKLTAIAGLAMTLGAAATVALEVGARRSQGWRPSQRAAALALIAFAVGLHAALPSLSGWIAPETWPGFMPPITLLSFLCGSIAVWACMRRFPG
jgi:hypothetical protein